MFPSSPRIARFFFLTTTALMFFSSCKNGKKAETLQDDPIARQVAEILDSTSLENKVAQLFIVTERKDGMDKLLSHGPSGLVMFAWGFEGRDSAQVQAKLDSFRRFCPIPLIIMTDEEGGRVCRLSYHQKLRKTRFPSPRNLLAAGGVDSLLKIEAEKANLIRTLGIDMNLAPVADISQNPNDFIYPRSLGLSPDSASNVIAKMVKTAHSHGVSVCIKHFPGYGDCADTHFGIVYDKRSRERLVSYDLIPFKGAVSEGCDAIMVSHNIIYDVDSICPASISAPLHEMLRKELGFDGIIMTDEMSMKAIRDNYEKPYLKALTSGNNLIMLHGFEDAYEEILQAVRDSTISESLIDEALRPVIRYRLEHFAKEQ